MIAHQPFELGLALVGPPQPLLGEILLEVQDLAPLLDLFSGLGRVRPLVELHHELRAAVLLPGFIGTPKFVFRAGLGVGHRGAEALPEDANEEVTNLETQDLIDEPLWPFGMNAGLGVGLPTHELQPQATLRRDTPIDLGQDGGQSVAFGLHIAG